MVDRHDSEKLGVHDVSKGLHFALLQYIEAQYHIKDEGLIGERRALLEHSGVIAQKPFVEATPIYAQVDGYSELKIPEIVKDVLSSISRLEKNSGLYPKPYKHQAEALEEFFGAENIDLVIATGTGSGKTESFLMPIIGSLAIESRTRPKSSSLSGCRAILLYPMNALVSDQMARIRRLLGNENVNKIIRGERNRPIRFGSYIGRTPYPGPRTNEKDRENVASLFDDFYLKIESIPSVKSTLTDMGRWPSKDLIGFYNEGAKVEKGKKDGKIQYWQHWRKRFLTQPTDSELMTRHEMQVECPDLIVTNYSMLEYMLLRPIERSLFEQTAKWLAEDEDNKIILVLDEAHMYRGAGGAEVAFLIRRLMSRLGISRDRMRCILTSASLGSDENAKKEIGQFASDLTGQVNDSSHYFRVITGTREQRGIGRPATIAETTAFASCSIGSLTNISLNQVAAAQTITNLAKELGWESSPDDVANLPDFLFSVLNGYGPADLLINSVMGKACSLESLQCLIFPSNHEEYAKSALDVLLVLCSIAKRRSDGRILMPSRLHLFYRGLPGLYACIDPNCTNRLTITDNATSLLGRYHTKPLLSCDCDTSSRVYEFLTHRDCGAALLKGWVDDKADFIWHEPDAISMDDQKRKLYPIEMLVENRPNPSAHVRQVWIHLITGKLSQSRPYNLSEFRSAWIPDKDVSTTLELTFDVCPICCRKTSFSPEEPSKIMDHKTKGEAPFSALVRTQLKSQPTTKLADRVFPNAGRKVLVFSDGRQKAARLARDMPRDMELDVFRQAIALAASDLSQLDFEPKPIDNMLYLAFLETLRKNNLSMFDIESEVIDRQIEALDENSDLASLLDDRHFPGNPPSRYKIALLKLLCSSYYSLSGTTIGYVVPTKNSLKKLEKKFGNVFSLEELCSLSVSWIEDLLGEYAYDPDIPLYSRARAAGFWKKGGWGSRGKFGRIFRLALERRFTIDSTTIEMLEQEFRSVFAVEKEGFFINPNSIKLNIDLNCTWYQCNGCTYLIPMTFRNGCIFCGETNLRDVPINDKYLLARKSFWRNPIEQAFQDQSSIYNVFAEEHTAQLSNRDKKSVHSTTELHELRFQDILISKKDRPVDILSCTTTMEVGIDIGSLVAVALRNVPPQRENYQQRAGRAGRRGAAVSSVVTYSQNGPHDGFYFTNPQKIISGDPRSPELKIDNPKIARRHVHSFLLQTFFHQFSISGTESANLGKAFGKTKDFFSEISSEVNFDSFSAWIKSSVLTAPYSLRNVIVAWIPNNLSIDISVDTWVMNTVEEFINNLEKLRKKVLNEIIQYKDYEDSEGLNDQIFEKEDLLEYLFFHAFLPSYAFPTSLCSFLVENLAKGEVRIEQMPQQSTNQALSEYAPGRLVIINKKTYRSGGVFASAAHSNLHRSEKLFSEAKDLIMCTRCPYVRDPRTKDSHLAYCPVCSGTLQKKLVIQPEIFGPEKARDLPEDDREQEITYATMAQFPQPVDGEDFDFSSVNSNLKFAYATDKRLITLNKGLVDKDESMGFFVCDKCGSAHVNDGSFVDGKHKRPYLTKHKDAGEFCDGQFKNVFLWFDFSTDLLLIRVQIFEPLVTDLKSNATVRILESAAHSVAEALRLAASRHRQLDLDPTEFGSGHRLVPPSEDNNSISLDIYLYDTLSGGAGYSELAAKYFQEIIVDALKILEGCNCDTSCTECLDHFHNQYLKRLLDRKLGASFLRYAIYSEVPSVGSIDEQKKTFNALFNYLAMDGLSGSFAIENDRLVSLRVNNGAKEILIRPYSSLLIKPAEKGVYFFSELALRGDLPGVHAKIRDIFS